MPLVEHFERNLLGRDIAVGDIHGHFTRLQSALDGIGFDPRVDRLFSVGDLVDRGPECELALWWLTLPWFHAVRGNHEDIAMRYARGNSVELGTYIENGGGWFLQLDPGMRQQFARAFERLPLAAEVETAHGLVGLIHADSPVRRWSLLPAALRLRRGARDRAMWMRERLANQDRSGVDGLRALVVGHTPVAEPVILGNVYHIDTGGWTDTGHFTLLDLDTLSFPPSGQS